MTDHDMSLRYDPNWPPKDNKRSLHLFTKKEDALIVDYLIDTKQFDRLGGNEVWKTMCRSKKYNPAGRTYQGLRERFLKHIVKHLDLYTRVTPQIKGRFLKQNPKALKDINAMKSTKDLKRELEARWSSDGEDDEVGENVPSNNTAMTPVLLERQRLLEELEGPKGMTSTPLEKLSDQIPSNAIEPAEEPIEKETTNAAAREPHDSSHLFTSQSAVESSVDDCLNKPQDMMLVSLSQICPSLCFTFEGLKAVDEHQDVGHILQLLQDSLRVALETHSNTLTAKSFACLRSSCAGTLTYFGLWKELNSYFEKIELYQLRFDACYVKFFIRAVREILSTPLCCAEPPPKDITLRAEDLYEYLCCELAEPFRNNLRTVQKLITYIREKED